MLYYIILTKLINTKYLWRYNVNTRRRKINTIYSSYCLSNKRDQPRVGNVMNIVSGDAYEYI